MSVFEDVAPEPPSASPESGSAGQWREPPRPVVRISSIVLGVILATILVVAGSWMLTGGRFFIMTTPSMSPTVPVGALVLTKPYTPERVHVGSIIAFTPPHNPSTYMHRVVAITPAGYQTKGDAAANVDNWVVPRSSIKAVAVASIPGLGWLVRALPWLLVGLLFCVLLAAWVPWRWGVFIPLLATVVVLSVPVFMLRPLVRGEVLFSTTVRNTFIARMVNTGLLPMKFRAGSQPWVHAAPGHFVTVSAPHPTNRSVSISGAVDLSLLGWVTLITICLFPLIIGVLVSAREWKMQDEQTPTAPVEELASA